MDPPKRASSNNWFLSQTHFSGIPSEVSAGNQEESTFQQIGRPLKVDEFPHSVQWFYLYAWLELPDGADHCQAAQCKMSRAQVMFLLESAIAECDHELRIPKNQPSLEFFLLPLFKHRNSQSAIERLEPGTGRVDALPLQGLEYGCVKELLSIAASSKTFRNRMGLRAPTAATSWATAHWRGGRFLRISRAAEIFCPVSQSISWRLLDYPKMLPPFWDHFRIFSQCPTVPHRSDIFFVENHRWSILFTDRFQTAENSGKKNGREELVCTISGEYLCRNMMIVFKA